jgi:hypothetical protein
MLTEIEFKLIKLSTYIYFTFNDCYVYSLNLSDKKSDLLREFTDVPYAKLIKNLILNTDTENLKLKLTSDKDYRRIIIKLCNANIVNDVQNIIKDELNLNFYNKENITNFVLDKYELNKLHNIKILYSLNVDYYLKELKKDNIINFEYKYCDCYIIINNRNYVNKC